MKIKTQTANQNCPVRGCRTKKPHTDDPVVAGLVREFSDPQKITSHSLAAMVELRASIKRDYEENLLFSWYSRLRQPEELYIRTLYTLFSAKIDELPHLMSGDAPNGLTPMYAKVNELVFEGRGALTTTQPGLQFGDFKPIDMLHDGAHVTFASFFTCIGLVKNPELWREKAVSHLQHLGIYCDRLNYMNQMFAAGKDCTIVLAALKQLHRP